MDSRYFTPSHSIAQIPSPTNRISTCLCEKCGHTIFFDASPLDLHEILEHARSGYTPTSSERVAYLGKLEEARHEIERFEIELRRLREVTQKLEEQQRFLQAYVAGIQHITSAIQRLPLEILGIIFRYVCCGKDATDIVNNYQTSGPYALTTRLPTLDVSSVCSRWYKFVTSTPIFWTSFGHDDDSFVSRNLVRTFLKRSRSKLINFRVSDDPSNKFFYPTPLVSHCDRWYHGSIAGSFAFVNEVFLEPLVQYGASASNLRSLELDCYARELFELPTALFPSLETLVLRGIILDFETPRYTVTTLHLSKVTYFDALSFLSTFPNLENLKMEYIYSELSDTPTFAPIVFDKMQTLILSLPLASGFLTTLKFPHLVHLYLCYSNDLGYVGNGTQTIFSLQTTLSILDQDFCALTHLSIQAMLLRYDEVAELFRLVPSLTHLDAEESITRSRRLDTIRWILELLAGPQHPGLPLAMATPEIDVDEDINSSFDSDDDSDMDEESNSDQVDEEDHNGDLQEPLLPRLVALNLSMRPRNRLLLDVVRSRQQILEDTPGPRACLQKLRIRHPHRFARYWKISPHFEALQKSLEPFEERGLDVDIEMPVAWVAVPTPPHTYDFLDDF
ncbi:hypothetical protein F5878DRAFT_724162 [Lentinula raphanica]|uniref:F-box domain-containing protein n=1 Tax=Lentinula raphanica TaxID=153919 RepID=A0AA38PBL2_9AGAR|nr:hypothetical protein F5878DRAFT_724162 [Lentinula raphanica]